jgi:hypothetical protein
MQTGIWNSLTCSLWLWGFGHTKIQAPGSSFYETRWLKTSVSKILHFVQGAGLLNEWAKGLHKRLIMVEVYGSLLWPPFHIIFYSIRQWSCNLSTGQFHIVWIVIVPCWPWLNVTGYSLEECWGTVAWGNEIISQQQLVSRFWRSICWHKVANWAVRDWMNRITKNTGSICH